MADDFPDLHHKLCKQLAALTTAIYHLNTKNDENDYILQTYLQTYEQEMDNIVKGANATIEKMIKENAQAFELQKVHDSYKAFKSQIEEARSSSVKEFNAFEENMKFREKTIQEEAEKQVNMYKTEVEGLKEKIWQMQKLVEKFVGSDIKFDEEEHKAKEKENMRIRKELEEKNKEMAELGVKYAELENMYRELDENQDATGRHWGKNSLEGNTSGPDLWEVEILKGKIEEQEKMIVSLRQAISKQNGFYDGEYVESIELANNTNREISELGVQITNLQREAEVSERLIREREGEIDRLKDQLKEQINDERMRRKIEDYVNIIEKMRTEYNENIAEMEDDYQREIAKLHTKMQGMQATLDSRDEYISGMEEKFRELEASKEKMEQEIQQYKKGQEKEITLNEEVHKLQKLVDENLKSYERSLETARTKAEEEKLLAIEEIKMDNEKSMQTLREDFTHRKTNAEIQKEATIKELEAEIERLKQFPLQQAENKTKEIAEEYQNKVNELSQRHNAALRDLMEKHEEKLDQVHKKYEKELEEVRKELQNEKDNILKSKDEDKNSEIARLKKDYEDKLKKISKSYDKQLEEKLQEYVSKISAKDLEIVELRAEIDKIKEDIRKDLEKYEEKEADYKVLQKLVDDQKNTIELLQDEMREGFLEEGGSTFRNELSKVKEGDYNDKGREDMIIEHLKYAERTEKKFRDLKKQTEERIEILNNRYNELVELFNTRPSRGEDVAKIRQLEEETRRWSEKSKMTPSEGLKRDDYQVFNSQPVFSPAMFNSIKAKKSQKTMSPSHATTSLPPISISQFSIQMRAPPTSNTMVTTKKFFK